MGDGVSDLARRDEDPEGAEERVRQAIRDGGGVITWWPGGHSHDAVLRLRSAGEVVLEDVSGTQETKYEVRPGPNFRRAQ